MGLFGKKTVKPTPAQKQEINAMLSRMGTCCKRLESVDSVDRYFTEWDKYLNEYKMLTAYANQGIKFTVAPQQIHNQILNEIPRIEHDVATRGYDRMQRDSAKLTTDKGKQKKADAFFGELEFYYPRLQPSTVAYIKGLRQNDRYATKEEVAVSSAVMCPKCGALLDAGAVFCGKCGAKVE